ncbi:MAG: yidA 2 [Firmicutes bacterium]|nr:yidA 2 [Bacillota bacterium]
MTIKLIALDLDDTLLNNGKKVSLRASKAIRQAVKQGVTVTMATGRMYKSALPYALELELDVPIITYNGALVKWSKSGETLFHQPIDSATTREVLSLFKERGWYVQAYVDDQLYVDKLNSKSDYYERMTGIAAIPLDEKFYKLEGEPSKMLAIAEPEDIGGIRQVMADTFGSRLNLAVSGPRYLEIVNPMVNKGMALKFLAESLGIVRAEVMAVGDSQNDLSMIKYAGFGVAMGNAMANDADGVAEAIENYVLATR